MSRTGRLTRHDIEVARTFLFVPGSRPDRFDKAVDSGVDVVILDLEDAVDPAQKREARRHVASWLATGGRAIVRVNALGTKWIEDDLESIAAAAFVVPKVERASDLELVRDIGSSVTPVIPLIETPRGVLDAERICASSNVIRVAFGNVDFAAAVGVDPSSRTALVHARSQIVYASAAAGCPPPIDGVTTSVDDTDLVRQDARHGRELGFGAKLLIHPSQVDPAGQVFAPTVDEVSWARSVLGATSGGAGVVDGHMVDEPVRARARRLLDDVERLSSRTTTPEDSE
jgi:citrate lyase subunit beta/citryl-CoA lyase